MTEVLERAVARFRQEPGDGLRAENARVSAAAFRAMILERLRGVEQDIGEVKSRVNGLVFVVIGAVITQVVLRLFG